MSELDPVAKNLIVAMGSADEPSNADQERVWRALQASLGGAIVTGANAVHGANQAAALETSGTASALAGKSAVSLSKVALWFGVGIAAGTGVSVAALPKSNVSAPSAPTAISSVPRGAPVRVETQRSTRIEPVTPASSLVVPRALPSPTASAKITSKAPAASSARGAEPVAASPSVVESQGRDPQPLAQDANGLAEEVRVLEQAQRARASGQCQLSLRWLGEYAKRFPTGALKSESVAAEVLCLCELGRNAEARARARQVISSQPNSAVAQRVLGSCVGEAVPKVR